MREILKKVFSNKKIRRIVSIVCISVSLIAASVYIFQSVRSQFLLPAKRDLDIIMTEGLPDAINENLYLIPVKCKRAGAGFEALVTDFKIHICALEGTIEKITYAGIIPKNKKKVDEMLKGGQISSVSSIEYPPIDERSEFTIIVFIRTDGRLPRLQIVGCTDGQKARIIRSQDVLDEILFKFWKARPL